MYLIVFYNFSSKRHPILNKYVLKYCTFIIKLSKVME